METYIEYESWLNLSPRAREIQFTLQLEFAKVTTCLLILGGYLHLFCYRLRVMIKSFE